MRRACLEGSPLAKSGCGVTSGSEHLGLLGGELLLSQHSFVAELAELLQPLDRVRLRGRRRRRLTVGLLGFLLCPAACLTTRDAIADGGGGSRDDGRPCDSPYLSWHDLLLSLS